MSPASNLEGACREEEVGLLFSPSREVNGLGFSLTHTLGSFGVTPRCSLPEVVVWDYQHQRHDSNGEKAGLPTSARGMNREGQRYPRKENSRFKPNGSAFKIVAAANPVASLMVGNSRNPRFRRGAPWPHNRPAVQVMCRNLSRSYATRIHREPKIPPSSLVVLGFLRLELRLIFIS